MDLNKEEFLKRMHDVILNKLTMDQLATYALKEFPISTHKSVRVEVFKKFVEEQVDIFLKDILKDIISIDRVKTEVKSLKFKIGIVHACLTINVNLEVMILKSLYEKAHDILQNDALESKLCNIDEFYRQQKETIECEKSPKSARKYLIEVLENIMIDVVNAWVIHNAYKPGSSNFEALQTEFSKLQKNKHL